MAIARLRKTYNGHPVVRNLGPYPINKHVVPNGMGAGQLLITQHTEALPSNPNLSSTTPVATIVVDGGGGQPVLRTFEGVPTGEDWYRWQSQDWPLLITQPNTLWDSAYTYNIKTVEYAYLTDSNFNRYGDGWLMGKLNNCKSVNIIIDNDVVDFNNAFHDSNNSDIESLTISHKEPNSTASLSSLDNMFQNSYSNSKLTVLDMSYMNLSHVYTMYRMCESCLSLRRVLMRPNVLNELSDLQSAFLDCRLLEEWSPINVGETFELPNIANVKQSFMGCPILEADILQFYQKASEIIYNRYRDCFTGCSVQASAAVRDMRLQIPKSWGGLMS